MKEVIIFDFYKTIFNPQTNRMYWGMKALLINLSVNNRLILITTGTSIREKQVQGTEIRRYFDRVIVCTKKTPRIYKQFDAQMKPIVVGDRIEEEITIGKKLGYRTIQVMASMKNPYYFLKVELANYL